MPDTQVAKMNEKEDQEKTKEDEGTICGGGQAGKEEKVTSQQEEKLIHECKICGYKCRRHCNLPQHMVPQSEKLLYACHICDKTFKFRIALKYHKATHSDVLPYHCQHCGKAFKIPSHLTLHMKTHSKLRLKHLQCRICSKPFNDSSLLEQHIKTNIDKKMHECMKCSNFFKALSSWEEHFIRDHQEEFYAHGGIIIPEKIHNWPDCRLPFKTVEHLNDHLVGMHAVRDQNVQDEQQSLNKEATFDNFNIVSESSLFEQRREEFLPPNQPKKILQHPNLTETFSGVSALDTPTNIRQHVDENQTIDRAAENKKDSDSDEDSDSAQEEQLPFECQLCHERFRTVEELNALNKQTHLVIKHLKCGKIFTSLSDFNRHFQHNQCKAVEKEQNEDSEEDADSAHKVQIPYVCQNCYEGFSTLELLNEHSKEKHSVVCEQCGETFNTQSELNRHNRHKWCKRVENVQEPGRDNDRK